MSEKQQYTPLPVSEPVEPTAPAPRKRPALWKIGIPLVVLFVLAGHMARFGGCGKDKGMAAHGHGSHGVHGHGHGPHGMSSWTHGSSAYASALQAASCPKQPGPLDVGDNWDPVGDEAYGELSARRLSRAVQINTVSTDQMPDDATDPRFDGHYRFAEFLEDEYASVYETLEHEMVNTHGHLWTWQGKNRDLKPVLLMAHIDTVPVNPDTVGQWTYPPWSGEITKDATEDTPGVWIWGRGASDCKNSVTGILDAVEKLISDGFEPERTILIAYGFDEEIGGARGAMEIDIILEERYGKDGISFIVDEGFSGISDVYGTRVAALGMAEKGSLSVHLQVDTLGGHSSVPPPHTGIGYMSRFINELEAHPFKPTLEPESPYLKYLMCMAEHAPEFPSKLRKKVQNPKKWGKLATQLAKDRMLNAYLATTTAVDLINGGVKVNALPEVVEATVNHRIAFTSSVKETKEHYIDLLVPLAHKLGFSVSVFGKDEKRTDRHLNISVVGNEHPDGLEPAPITPSNTAAFEFIAGTIKTIWGKNTVVAPDAMFANTDTARSWNLTNNIYRFTPASMAETVSVHTVNERMALHGHLTTTRFYYKLIRNTEVLED